MTFLYQKGIFSTRYFRTEARRMGRKGVTDLTPEIYPPYYRYISKGVWVRRRKWMRKRMGPVTLTRIG